MNVEELRERLPALAPGDYSQAQLEDLLGKPKDMTPLQFAKLLQAGFRLAGHRQKLRNHGVRVYRVLARPIQAAPEPPAKKSPLGIMPEAIWQELRMWELIGCIERYRADDEGPKYEWMCELHARLGEYLNRAVVVDR